MPTGTIVSRGQSDDDALVLSLRGAGSTWTAGDILALLVEAPAARVRNAAALALADRQEPDAKQALAELLARPGIASCAGTLLYALAELGGTLPVTTLVTLVRDGSFEARAEILDAAFEGRITGTWDHFEAARATLAELARSGDTEAAEAAEDALDALAGRIGA